MLRNKFYFMGVLLFLFAFYSCKKKIDCGIPPSVEGEWKCLKNDSLGFNYIQFGNEKFKLRGYDSKKGYDNTVTGVYKHCNDTVTLDIGKDNYLYPLTFDETKLKVIISKYPYSDSLHNTYLVMRHTKPDSTTIDITYLKQE